MGIVQRHAGGREVQAVHLRVGALRQIVPDTLVYCWSLVTEGSPLASATLDVEQIPATIRCASCHHVQELDAPVLVCAGCAGQDVEVVTGEEFLITSLELTEA
jgi:hydrogenase nickel incorporation protein HypA/HybF